jgi:hypothetical protein
MSRISPNVRIRPNVISMDDFLSRSTSDFTNALTWEELNQYLRLSFQVMRDEILSRLTLEQRAGRHYLLMTDQTLPDPYQQICTAHQFLLPPPGILNGEGNNDQPSVEDSPIKVSRKGPVPAAIENPQERVIWAPVNARQLVLAPPGTGKTHAVIQRLAHLNQQAQFGGDLSCVLLVSFSRAAAAEIGQRLAATIRQGVSRVYSFPRLSTLDSLAGQLLVRDLGLPIQSRAFDDSIRALADILSDEQSTRLKQVSINLLRQRIRVVIIDEVQDVVGVRARLVQTLLNALKAVDPGVLVLGDLRQAIFGFALNKQPAGDQAWTPFRLVRELQALFPDLERIEFTRQHRFSPTCQQLMTDLRGAMDTPPALPGEHPDLSRLRGLLSRVQELDDPHMLFGDEFSGHRVAVLTRDNHEVDQLEVAIHPIAQSLGRTIRRSGDGGKGGYPAWVARMLANQPFHNSLTEQGFFQLYRQQVSDDPHAARQALDWLAMACRLDPKAFHIADVIESVEGDSRVPTDLREPARPGEMWLSTIHQAKGREFEIVVVADADRILNSGEAEEARILYVALTRAKSIVFRCRGPGWLPRAFRAPDTSPLDLAGNSLHRLQAQDLQEALWNCYRSFREVLVAPAQDGAYHIEIMGAARVIGPRVTQEFRDDVASQAGVRNVLELERPTFRLEVGSLRSRVVGVMEERRLVLIPIFSGPVPVRR